jgi:hypothetical protein
MNNNIKKHDILSGVENSEVKKPLLVFKYLDVNGATAMLVNSNIQFTNATRLNDPFDCHPSLIDFSKITPQQCKGWPEDVAIDLESHRHKIDRDQTWVCCLSKNFRSILMWSYYNNHKGVCIGLDIERVKKHIHWMLGASVDNTCHEVIYRDIICKPDYFTDKENFFYYQMLTKAKGWSHEEEMRMFIWEPHQLCMDMLPPYKPEKDEVIDWKDMRAYPSIDAECFAKIYLGVNINKKDRETIVKSARRLNPNIEIYQMIVNPDEFKLEYTRV